MKKAAVSILIFLFLGSVSLFSQDGEEIDFLEKVSEPKKKTVGKKTSNSVSSNASKVSKKKEKKKFKKKRSKKSPTVPIHPENSKKNTELDNNGATEASFGNNNESNSSSNTQTKESGNVGVQSTESASKTDPVELSKPYWVNEEMKVRPNNLPGYTASVESEKPEQGTSFRNSLSEILKLGEDKKKEEEKRKVQQGQKPGSFTGFLSEYKKPIIIVVFILLFALYRLKAGKSRGNSSRRSPVTINKMRRD
ncbi:SRP-less Sec system protein [Leptospira santarosai]|uniref:SRP-less Sec system protein n=1 Tax=Leptospira santarosai TaxID=28183 RepID=UPI0007744CBF|nr:SRP-less Sec system protein [Leptospira santarosai]